MRKALLTGRLTAAPTISVISGYNTAKFSIAVQNGKKDDQGNWGVDYYNCIAWGNLHERCTKYAKGQMVALTGDLNQNSYTGKDGTPRFSMEVRVDSIEACAPAPGAAKPQTGGDAAPSQSEPDDFLEGLD